MVDSVLPTDVSSSLVGFMCTSWGLYYLENILSRMSEKITVTRPATIPTRIIGLRYSMKLMPNI